MQQALQDGGFLLIEATSNQVNQFGGYTGMQPEDFRRFVLETAQQCGLPEERLILGGDHLGPNPWQHLPAEEAMRHAEAMVAAYAGAGFTKIHLDASMSCADDPVPLPVAVVAQRAARLCAMAEAHAEGREICYVIGTEVPVPGGATESLSHMQITTAESVRQMLEQHQQAFLQAGLESAWNRILAVVVQPGVEFNHDSVVDYLPEKTVPLQQWQRSTPSLVFEAHSTDYQRPEAYRQLVQDGFAVLKVGPALTFALREALFALAAMEEELVPPAQASHLVEVMEDQMLRRPEYWKAHYHGDARTQQLLRRYSYSDRIRYYWTGSAARNAVSTLLHNLEQAGVPENMLSQYLPDQYVAVRAGRIACKAKAIALDRIRQVVESYASGCRPAEARL